MRKCSFPGCDRKHKAHGYCDAHRSQLRHRGSIGPLKGARVFNQSVIRDGKLCVLAKRGRAGYVEFFVDLSDKDILTGSTWAVNSEGYVESGSGVALHSLLMPRVPGKVVDHKDRNPLNNCRSNLRYATPAESSYNTGIKKTNTSGYKNVTWEKSAWLAYIGYRRRFIRIGRFQDPVEAAKAYDKVAVELHGEFAVTNAMLGLV